MPADKDLKEKARFLKPIMTIGKNGITEGSIKQLAIDLEHQELVKVKFLRGFIGEGDEKIDRKEKAQELANLARARLVQVVGNVVVLFKPKKQ